MKGQNLSAKRCFNLVSVGFVMCARGWLFIYFFGKMKRLMLCMNFEEFSKNGSLPFLCFLLLQRRNRVCINFTSNSFHFPAYISSLLSFKWHTVDSRYLEIQGTIWTLRDIRTSTYQICWNCGKLLIEQPPLTEWICNLTPKLEIYWKYCEKEEKLLLRSNFSLFPQYFESYW